MNIEEAKRYAEAIRTINRYEISTPMKDSDPPPSDRGRQAEDHLRDLPYPPRICRQMRYVP